MKRRDFVKASALSLPVMGMGMHFNTLEEKANNVFNLDFAPHHGMFKSAGKMFLDQLRYIYDLGFKAIEDNGMMDRDVSEQESLGGFMASKNMRMGVFVAHKIHWKEPNLTSGDKDFRKSFLNDIKKSVAVSKRVNAKWVTVVPGSVDQRKEMGQQTANVIESLKYACDILEKEGITMVLEPLNFRDHPGMFLRKSAQAYQICKAVNSSSCKILFDIYHQQITEGNLIPNIEAYWDEIAYFQIGDNPKRNEPGTGEINFANVFKYIKDRGYKGILGMEHGNSLAGKKGEKAVYEAYKKVNPS